MTDLATEIDELRPRICVIGVGGAGGNAVANMIESDVCGVEFIAVNTDAQALRHSPAHQVVQLGRAITQGLGAGSRAEIGKAAAEESLADIEEILDGAHMCFIAAGMGGGTGSGAAPVIAKAARDRGILTVGVVTKPFTFEGSRRARTAELGIEELRRHVDTLIVIPNQNLFRIASVDMSFKAAFALADDVLQKGVRGITDLMTMPGLINLDFADIRTIMANTGSAMLGVGEASGEQRALRAAEQAIANPLLDEAMKGATGLIISITGSDDIGLWEIDEIAGLVGSIADPDADIIWGSAFDQSLAGAIRVSVVATGLDLPAAAAATPAVPASLPGPSPDPVARISPATPPLARQEPDEHRSPLAPPPGAMAFTTIDPFAVEQAGEPAPSLIEDALAPGRTLFERMAMMARGVPDGAGDSHAGSDPYREPGHRIIARQAA